MTDMRPDDHDEKKRMKGQTEVKHEILEKYLGPWLNKITEVSGDIRYVDGFAGWGQYPDGSPGSPLIAMQVVKEGIEDDVGRLNQKLDNFQCTFIEKNEQNFRDLKNSVQQILPNCPPQIKVDLQNREFNEYAQDFISEKRRVPPTFIFIDPFGFSGVPFETVSDLMNMRATGMELFITFMSGPMARFDSSKSHRIAIDEILGTDRWREEINDDLSRDKKAEEFVKLYEDQLREEAGVEYVWPFEMKKEESRQTNYYLVHATNHFDGIKLMKDIMFNAGADEQFAYLGPDHYGYEDTQQSLKDFDARNESDKRIQELANLLHDRFEGSEYTFLEVMEQTYEETTLIETHYRDACELLDEQGRAEIINRPDQYQGTKTGLNKDDKVRFLEFSGLSDFV